LAEKVLEAENTELKVEFMVAQSAIKVYERDFAVSNPTSMAFSTLQMGLGTHKVFPLLASI
jgi:hypothetical protein